MKKILIVEDDYSLNNGIALALKQEEYAFFQSYNLEEGLLQLEEQTFDLIILDVNLPDGNGYSLLQKVRKNSNVPVLILTANDMEMDEVLGFEYGANDYVTKPFSLMVLRARIHNLLHNIVKNQDIFHRNNLLFDFPNMIFKKDNTEIILSKTEQKLLFLLVSNTGRTLTREVLMDKIWSDGANFVDENALSVTVKRLRDKIEDNASKPIYIQTVYGIGYTWRD
ncbi:response regulator transcription factor [Anaeromicropila herbilytica]|uniref:Stage 0 sporulation protein A homolog n=1 Tax=Anaeromicropila herbilytica TaxID=2785025 RepID=A0A7R7EHG0_9FIRM|nr:response regulator transcription factor [Anaeromicropila herbilytica]BCN28798.1 DNA-binding response regulator [Anaeromicropila herbilytica]